MSPDQGQANDAELAERLSQAQAVVAGVVTATDSPSDDGPPGLSMHNPKWARATIAVESVEKGRVPGKSADVFFSASEDIVWSKAPKLAKGQHGVWLLQSNDQSTRGAPGLAVVDPLDSRPIGELPKIRTLLKNSRGGK
jgi:hypothetical protein